MWLQYLDENELLVELTDSLQKEGRVEESLKVLSKLAENLEYLGTVADMQMVVTTLFFGLSFQSSFYRVEMFSTLTVGTLITQN